MKLHKRSEYLIAHHNLTRHIEGGYYSRTYENKRTIQDGQSIRPLSTGIVYLLDGNDTSSFHRLKSDELWCFHEGSELILHMFIENEGYSSIELGLSGTNTQPQCLIPGGTIFGAELKDKSSYTFVSCFVSPGFDFEDYKLFSSDQLIKMYPDYDTLIERINQHES